ncbi:uncharacterized protein TA05400 [Theileria annulata]|uniref:Uncharacterized protein n=1 Tax=Theileria annulata TaxID=5874 RepID=Q4UCS4_THEAN|nr:uncharacterized protein TA05400 [Theileria annulata]CAI75377.1 hypothetical protein TA05400 [Theileria annulata]|eukprot:XP_954853.1 hypothetical protein TA05400 [Theileria annulata]
MGSFDGLTESKFVDDMSHFDTKQDENNSKKFEISSFEGISTFSENMKLSDRVEDNDNKMVGGISGEPLKIKPTVEDYQFDDRENCNWSLEVRTSINTTRTQEEGNGIGNGGEDCETVKGISDSPDLMNLTPDPEKICSDFKNSTPEEERSENVSEPEIKKSNVPENSEQELSNPEPESIIECESSENLEKKMIKSKNQYEQEDDENEEIQEESKVCSSNGNWGNVDEENFDNEEIFSLQDEQPLTSNNRSMFESKEFKVIEVTEKTTPTSQLDEKNGSKATGEPEVIVSSPAVTYHSPENEFSSPVDEDYEKISSFNSYQYNSYEPGLEVTEHEIDVMACEDDQDDELKTIKKRSMNENMVCYKKENSITIISRNDSINRLDKGCKSECKKVDRWEDSEINSSTTIEIEEGETETKATKTRKAIQKFNTFFSAVKWAFLKSSLLFLVFFWLISMIYGSLSLSSNDWLVNTVAYKCGEITGHSYTFLGPYGLSRKDIAYLKDGAKLTLTRGLIYYNEIINKGYKDPEEQPPNREDGGDRGKCLVGDEGKLDDSECELPADLSMRHEGGMELSSDEEKARRIIMSTNEKINIYSQCGHERKFIKKSCCFRDMCAVGNLNESDTSYFKSLYGPTVYDIHYSEFENFDKGGQAIWYTGIVSLIFLFLAVVMVSERLMNDKVELTIRLAMRNMANILWIISVFLSVTAFFLWRYFSGGSVCVDELGKSRPCQYYYATYFFLIHIFSSLLGLVSYTANCIAGSRIVNTIRRI